MISFTVIDDENYSSVIAELCVSLKANDGCEESYTEEIEDVLSALLAYYSEEGASEIAATVAEGSLLVRLFDYGRYSFLYPIPLLPSADVLSALRAIRDYAVYEEVPLVLTDVPREDIAELCGYFRHIRLDSESADNASFTAEIFGDLSLIDSPPSISYGRIVLDALTEADIPEYARLSRDPEVNKFWGYDYREDYPDAPDAFFFEVQEGERSRGSALSLAVRFDGVLIGEAVLHADNLEGGVECAFRLFPEHWGKGLGRETLYAALALAERIGYRRIICRVKPENERSRKLLSSVMTPVGGEGFVFERNIITVVSE